MPYRTWAYLLLGLTLVYNVFEGVIAIAAGLHAHSLVLLTFGGDSYLEVAAAAALLWRLSRTDPEAGERAEALALRFIGATFLLLAAAVVFQSVVSLAGHEGAESSTVGLALLLVSALLMPAIAIAKLWVATRSGMPALAAEAKETVACSYLSFTALGGLVVVAVLGWWWLDPLAALLMVPWLVREGLEGLRGDACFDDVQLCWCRECWYGLRSCTDVRVPVRSTA